MQASSVQMLLEVVIWPHPKKEKRTKKPQMPRHAEGQRKVTYVGPGPTDCLRPATGVWGFIEISTEEVYV
jgi:hypothetical protein